MGTSWKVVGGWAGGALLVMAVILYAVNEHGGPPPSAAPSYAAPYPVLSHQPDLRQQQLTGVATWTLDRGGLQICVRQQLHGCTVRFGDPISNNTVTWPQTDIAPVASCDTQGHEALVACAALHPGDRPEQARCLLPRGMLMPDIETPVDPRDSPVSAGTLVIECAEGNATRSTQR